MYTSEQVRKKCWQRYQSACVEFIGAVAQIRDVYKDHKILVTLKRCIILPLRFQTLNTKFPLFYDCLTYENIFCLFDDSTNKIKAFHLKVNCKEMRLVFVHHLNTECT